MKRQLKRSFYKKDTQKVAKNLLGKLLIRKTDSAPLIARIVETEAYLPNDPASHSFLGVTKRNEVMFDDAGKLYIYQMHGFCCLNIVTEERNVGAAVLIRAAKPVKGHDVMKKKREKTKKNVSEKDLLSGPGKLCQALSIDMKFSGIDATSSSSPLQIWDDGRVFQTIATKRIGISKAVDKKLRFLVQGSSFISK